MSTKMLDATCDAEGKVTAAGVVVPETTVLSEGKKASSGVLLIEGEKARYVASSATDIKDLITKLVEIIDQISTIATTLDGVTVSPGTATTAITQLGVLKTQLDQSKGVLK